jgi:hypothetical protein
MKHSLHVKLWRMVFTGMAISVTCCLPAQAQQSRWARVDDATAKALINSERQWLESGCTPNGIEKTILADDFQGTAPDGSHYTKPQALADSAKDAPEEDCRLYDVTVHFFGDSIAILYGSESAVHIEANGRRHRVKLTWTDTWLRRHGKWQIVAAQDMPSEMN